MGLEDIHVHVCMIKWSDDVNMVKGLGMKIKYLSVVLKYEIPPYSIEGLVFDGTCKMIIHQII